MSFICTGGQGSYCFYRVLVTPGRRDSFFFFNDTATTEIYTLSLHDALPIFTDHLLPDGTGCELLRELRARSAAASRSEEHTSELQSQSNLVCRLLLEKNTDLEDHVALFDPVDDAAQDLALLARELRVDALAL